MKTKLLYLKQNWREQVGLLLAKSLLVFVVAALLFQISMVVVHFSGNTQLETNIANWFSWKFDGTFKNSPENIWYNADEHVWVESVTNDVKVGK